MGGSTKIRETRPQACASNTAALIFASFADLPRSAPTRLLRRQQSPADHIDVRQGGADFQPMQILGKAAVANLAEPEYAFDHADRVLDFGSHLRLGPVLDLFHGVEPTTAAVLAIGEILGTWRSSTDSRALTL